MYLNEDKELQMIQVAWSLEDEGTKEREVSALMVAMKERGVTKALLVTLEEEGWMEIEDLQIEIIPAWRYLLKN